MQPRDQISDARPTFMHGRPLLPLPLLLPLLPLLLLPLQQLLLLPPSPFCLVSS